MSGTTLRGFLRVGDLKPLDPAGAIGSSPNKAERQLA
jgi:hypothetical protein